MSAPQRRRRLTALSGPSPLEQATFLNVYGRVRVIAYLSAMLLAFTLGHWARYPVIPYAIAGVAAFGIAHTWWRRRASWIEMSMIDMTFLALMATASDVGEVVIIVVMAHVMAGWMFMPPRHALALTSYGTTVGIIGVTVVTYADLAAEIPARNLTVAITVLVVTVVIVSWLMLTTGLEVRRQRLQNEELLADKDQLLSDKTRLIASVSHELRTPLTGVVGFANELAANADELSTAEISELATLIAESSSELAALVEDLLVAARLDSGTLSVECVPLELGDAIGDLVPGGEATFTEGLVLGDAIRIRQIIRNLLTNATRYGGRRVAVTVEHRPGTATVTVADDGDGVVEEAVQRIFEPFGRAHRRRGRTDAMGLGLAISRQLAELMGGSLAYARVDGWTHFSLTLQAPSTVTTTAGDPAAIG